MKHWIRKTFLLLLIAGIVYAENVPAFKRQVIQVPISSPGWVQPSWKDINGDGLVDLLALVQRDKKVFIYIQNNSGLPIAPTQSIELPEGTAWITLYDINEHSGKEMLISINAIKTIGSIRRNKSNTNSGIRWENSIGTVGVSVRRRPTKSA